MTKLTTLVVAWFLGVVALAAAAPSLVRLAGALTPFVVVIGLVVAVLRVVWWLTR